MTIIVVLPFTFGLDPLQGLAAMTGVYVGGSAGGLVTAVPARHPGHAVGDRHHVRRPPDGDAKASPAAPSGSASGRRSSAGCSAACFSSAPPARWRQIALEFGPWEFFSLFVLALSMVAGLIEASLLKGLIAGALGLIVTVLGNDPVMRQEPRFTLGIRVPRAAASISCRC